MELESWKNGCLFALVVSKREENEDKIKKGMPNKPLMKL
jgi:hypothetical protein